MTKKVSHPNRGTRAECPSPQGPVSFSFSHLQPRSYTTCRRSDFFVEFLGRLRKLCELGWAGISTSHRHAYGWEKIPRESLPESLSADIDYLLAFRATGDNLAFLVKREGNVFDIYYLEAEFGDVYCHN